MDIRNHSAETAIIVAVFLKLVDIAPIKLNPWSALVNGIRKFFVGGVNERITAVEKNQSEIAETLANVNELMRARMSDIDYITNEKFDQFSKKIDLIAEKQDKLSRTQDETNMSTSRYRIIRAAGEVLSGQELSDDYIEQLGEDAEIYVNYCNNHPEFKNHKGKKSLQIFLDYEDMKLKREAEKNFKKEDN